MIDVRLTTMSDKEIQLKKEYDSLEFELKKLQGGLIKGIRVYNSEWIC